MLTARPFVRAIRLVDRETINRELESVIKEYGVYPFKYFNILLSSENPNIDFDKQNEGWSFVKNEKWHSLDMSNYVLWCISDNGDLLWWNGDQIIAMNPRASEYMSLPVGPAKFIDLVGIGKVTGIFPSQLWEKNA